MAQPGDLIAGKYRIVQLLGQGGMGAVYAATHMLTGKRVALKWLLPELATNVEIVQRFLREAQAAARVEHPNVVDVYDVGNDGGAHFLVMEFLDGESLGAAVERQALTAAQVLQVVIPALEGVGAAHRVGVIHRDIKPDNIFLCRDANGFVRNVKVLDFGISKLSEAAHPLGNLTQTGATMGTPHYMAPEQLRGSKEIDGRADIYSFGVILYETLTGRKPFEADTFGGLAMAVVSQTPPPPRALNAQIAPVLEQAVLKAIARDKVDRFATTAELVAAIRPFAATAPISPHAGAQAQERAPSVVFPSADHPVVQSVPKVTATPAATSFHAASRGLRKPMLWAAVAAGLLAATFVVAWLTRAANHAPAAAVEARSSVAPPAAAAHASQVDPVNRPPTAATPAQAPDSKPIAPASDKPHSDVAQSPGDTAANTASAPVASENASAQAKSESRAKKRVARGSSAPPLDTSRAHPSSSSSAPAGLSPPPSQPATRKLSPAVERVGDVTPDEF